jgi:hypothetical protein
MQVEIKQEIRRAKQRAANLMQTALEFRDSKWISKGKLALEDYRRASELGKAMLASLRAGGLS